MRDLNRRAVIGLVGGAAAWPLAARAQLSDGVRRIGALINLSADDPESTARVTAFAQTLQELGWTDGRNARIVPRWGMGDADRLHRYAAELVALAPDVIIATSSAAVAALQRATRTVPIVFVSVIDPVGGGFVERLSRPGGNTTGFALFEYSLSGKWLELLKQIVPAVTRAAVLREAMLTTAVSQYAVIQTVASSLGVEALPVEAHDLNAIEAALTAFAREPNGGLIVTGSPATVVHRDLIIRLAAQIRLPAVYPYRFFADMGGLVSYGPNSIDPYRRAARYVDRILRGEKPADLPVQAPTTYELTINLKTAKALGLTVPDMLLARANEVIE
jgi:putative ABC transport system substrate-binding protein